MYDWREMSEEDREKILKQRKYFQLPWHRPPRFNEEGEYRFFITAACYEHSHIIGKSFDRLIECEEVVLSICRAFAKDVFAWCILTNHYHLLLQTDNIKGLLHELGRFHGRSSKKWNIEDDLVGRKVWFNYLERQMRSERQFWTAMNYIHHNPVHHGHVNHWTDWLFSSAREFLKETGKEKATEILKKYPFEKYADKWD